MTAENCRRRWWTVVGEGGGSPNMVMVIDGRLGQTVANNGLCSAVVGVSGGGRRRVRPGDGRWETTNTNDFEKVVFWKNNF